MTSQETIWHSAALRGERQFREAIDLIKSTLSSFDKDLLMNAYREMFLAAKEAGFTEEALDYAKQLLILEPDLPSAKAYVAQYGGNV